MASPPGRPAFHLSHPGPGWAWPGDPNGIFFWKGRYHLHYIYDRGGAAGIDPLRRFLDGAGDYAFAHVSSPDLVHWTSHRTTLTPDVLGHGAFSGGGFVTKEGRPAIVYQGQGSGANHVVIAEDDDLERWTRPAPAVVHVRPGQDGSVIAHADPHAWLENDTYYAIFGGTTTGKPATLLRSADLADWEYLGVLLDPDLPDTGEDTDVSCPDFFPIGDQHMLLCISHNKGCRYYLGEWRDERFVPEVHGRMNWHATDVFAPESVLTPDGRRVMWAWAFIEAPWSGIQILPRELDLPGDGILRIRPLRELERLRADERSVRGIAVDDGSRLVSDVGGAALELAVTFGPGAARRFGVAVHCDARGGGGLRIEVDLDAGTVSAGAAAAPFDPGDEEVTLRVFVDTYLVDVFANDRQAIFLPHFADAADVHVAVFADGGDRVADLTAWRMTSMDEVTAP
ncbi:glycoside hydrolase family 32 protein [Jiangella anatolica]|uniref:beta-fructofuranosidase n=1 Tax=Jiangella anatolica TaxID=2670374 RepID=A0A2W2BHQ5_9ACTN|nr:glycoside hydrolase family 32 protein [Jiangella anatolica]PZF86645.1 hypothetical protein C1I92_00240 [Jiangella anatolica]